MAALAQDWVCLGRFLLVLDILLGWVGLGPRNDELSWVGSSEIIGRVPSWRTKFHM